MKLTRYVWLIGILLSACQFNTDDLYFVDLQKPEAPELEIVDLSLSQDTIFLTYYQNIQFNFSAGQNKVMQVSILIDGEEKYTRPNYEDSFTILASDLSEGVHKLSFSVITNSNSGSIADLLGYEGYQFLSNEWTLVCVKNDRMSSFVTKEVKDGKLKISWEEHNKVNFKAYRVVKRYHFSGWITEDFYTTNPYFIDEAYVGEKAYYDIYTEYYSSNGYEFHWAETQIENTLPEIKIRTNNSGQFEVYWEDNEFVAAIKNYRLIKLPTPADTITLHENLPGESNSFVIPEGVFGNQINYKLVVVPKMPDTPFDNDALYFHSKSYDGMIGEKAFQYDKISSIDGNELLVVRDNYIYHYSVEDKKPIDSLTFNWDNCGIGYYNFSLSPRRKYFTAKETCTNKIVLMNPKHLDNYQAYPISHIVTQGMYFESMPVSDNGIVVAKDYDGVHVYDIPNSKLIASVKSNDFIYDLGISSNGDYFYIKTHQLSFFKIAGDTIQNIWESAPFYEYVYSFQFYDSKNADNIILYDGKSLYHKNTSDFATTKSFNLSEGQILNVDLPNRQLLAYSNDYLSVYSIDTGELIARIKVNPDVALDQYRCTLAANTIYLDSGVCYNLPESL